VTENKRRLIHDSCGKFIGTLPFNLKGGLILERVPIVMYYLPSPIKLLLLPIYSIKYLASSSFVYQDITYLPEPLPKIIYIHHSLPPIKLLPDPTLKLLLPAPAPIVLLPTPISRTAYHYQP
jgi:hypothetical protein